MKKILLLLIALLPFVGQAREVDSSFVKDDSTRIDTTLHLSEVKVTASRIIHKVDRDILFPSPKIVQNSINGFDLLRKLKLPNIKVSEIQQNVTSFLGGVQLRINDMKANVQDILALQPNEVTRIEYIDNPGLKYGDDNLAVVINYIVKRRYSGYVGGVGVTQAFWEKFDNSNAFFKYNHKKSEFTLSYGLNYRWYDQRRSDVHSVYYQPDGMEHSVDYVGHNAEMTYNSHNLQLGYSLAESGKYTLSVKLGLGWMNAPYNKKIQSVITNEMPAHLLYTNNFGNTRNPALDIYYNVNMPKKQSLAINVVGTHLGSANNHNQNEFLLLTSVDETLGTKPLHDYSYYADGSKYSLIMEAIYSKMLNSSLSFSGGSNYQVSRTDNNYTGNQNVKTILNSNNVYVFSQLEGRIPKIINFQLGVGANYVSIWQGDIGFNKWTFRPKISLSTLGIRNFRIRLSGSMAPQVPSLSQLSEVRQQESSMQANDGNSLLKATSTYRGALDFSWNHKLFDLSWGGNLNYTPDAIMTSICLQKQKDGSFLYVWKPENQKSFSSYFAYTNLTLHLIKDVLDIQGELQYVHYKSRGLNYSHDTEPLHYGLSVFLMLKKWYIEYYFANAWEQLYGETSNKGENKSNLTIAYKHKRFRLGLSCMLLGYAQGYNYKAQTMSKYYKSYSNTYLKNNGNMLMFTFNYTISHGRTYKADRRKLNNSDSETGLR